MKISTHLKLAAPAVMLAVSLTLNARADLFEKFQRASSQITNAIGRVNKAQEAKAQIPEKKDEPPRADTKPSPDRRLDAKVDSSSSSSPETVNRDGGDGTPGSRPHRGRPSSPAEAANRDELAWPILPDGSLYLCTSGPNYYRNGHLNGEVSKSVIWDPATTQTMFGDVHPLSHSAMILLHVAHGLALHRKYPTHSVEEAIQAMPEYFKARGEFEKHDALARLRPRFEQELARIQIITNVTAFHWCLQGAYAFNLEAYPVTATARLWGRKSAFLDHNDRFWKPPSIPVPLAVAKQMDAEARQNKEHLALAVVVKGEIIDRDRDIAASISKGTGSRNLSPLLQEVSEGGDIDIGESPRTALVIRVKSAEALAVFYPATGTPGVPRVRILGPISLSQ